ncbi:PREDICTED: uncharacterized protein LOC108608813 [Drosophila arizonae]|uniref:Uncharacterized protein LOC108608813 n=1 Tax=Drosophila arizonae TaxID=7263 RepID=A0ABM1NLN9_DROAR|nr:PREDICTED: uncharacterized protein LOC108608813 [Drosophila arizonae]
MSPNTDPDEPFNPNEFLVIPKWINEDYFRPIVEQDVPDFVSIKNFTSIAATQPGENYTSIMVRVFIDIELKDGTEQRVSYILKTMLEATKGGALVNEMNLFPKETEMYQVHIPGYEKLYKEAGVDIKLAPKCLVVEVTPERTTLVLEDLKRQNFYNVDRLKGLDMPHMKRVLRKLAELHAASAVTREQNGPFSEMYYTSFYHEKNRDIFEQIGEMRMKQYVKAMREWQLPDVEKYIANMPAPSVMFEEALKLNKVDDTEFNCLNHGDLWCNNIMFAENGAEERTLFVDLQVGKWGSPAQDLWYFITTSAALDIKVKEFDHFISIYHERLVECLQLLKYSKHIPTLTELHIMMLKYGKWGPITANGVLVAIILPSDKDSSIDMMMTPGPEGDAFRYKTFINPYYVKAMLQLYPFFTHKGLL